MSNEVNQTPTEEPKITTPPLEESTTPVPEDSSNDALPAEPSEGNSDPVSDDSSDAASDYEIEVADNSPLTEADLEVIAQYAEKHQLSKEEAQALITREEELYTRGQQQLELQRTQELEVRRSSLNNHPDFAGDNAAHSWAAVKKAVEVFGNEQLVSTLSSPEFGYDLNLALMLKQIGEQLMPEVPAGKGAPTGGKPEISPEEARLRRAYPEFYQDS
jgi:hypothetical protein